MARSRRGTFNPSLKMPDAICLLIAPLISFVVSVLKKIPFVKAYPKSVVFFISAIVGGWTSTHGSPQGIDYTQIVTCILAQFSGAVATHEAVTNQVQKVIDFRESPSDNRS